MGRKSPLGIEGTAVSFRDAGKGGRMTVAMVRAKDENNVYQVKRFDILSWHRNSTPIIPAAAIEWARETRHGFIKGTSVAGPCDFQVYAQLLGENLETAGVGQGRLDFIANISKGLKVKKISDMKADNFAASVRKWITGLSAGWSMAKDAPNRRKGKDPLSPATRNKILVVCRQVTGLAIKRRKLPFDPLAELDRFKESERIKPLFTITELRQMVSDEARNHSVVAKQALETEILRQSGTKKAVMLAIAKQRNCHWSSLYNTLRRSDEPDPWWLACCLLVYTGCRAQEAMHLRWEWIGWEQRTITLRLADDYGNKSDAERMIPLEPELAEILRPLAKPHGHILPNEVRAGGSGVKIREKQGEGAKDYTNALRLYLRRIGMDPGERTAHSLRHSYVTMKLARADTNVERLRKAVGHRDFSTTMGYGQQSQFYEAEVDQWPDSTLWLRRSITISSVQQNGVSK